MKSSDTRPAKISLVNLVKNRTRVYPWKPATRREMMKTQTPIQTLQYRNMVLNGKRLRLKP